METMMDEDQEDMTTTTRTQSYQYLRQHPLHFSNRASPNNNINNGNYSTQQQQRSPPQDINTFDFDSNTQNAMFEGGRVGELQRIQNFEDPFSVGMGKQLTSGASGGKVSGKRKFTENLS